MNKGTRYDFIEDGSTFEIIETTTNNIYLEDIEGRKPRVFSISEFLEALATKQIEPHRLITPRNILSPNRRAVMEKRLVYVLAHERLIHQGMIEGEGITNEALKLLKNELKETHPEFALNMPALATLSRWKAAWRVHKRDTDLAPKHESRPGRKDPRTVQHAKSFIFNKYLSSDTKPSIRAIYDLYRAEAEDLKNRNKFEDIIEERHFYRLKDEMNSADLEYAYSDHSYRAKIARTLSNEIVIPYPLQRVEIDRVQFNFGVFFDDDTYAGSVSMYIAIDCCTRVILGITVEVGNAESSKGTLNLFKEMLTPYSDEMPYCGVPHGVVLDNGPGMANQWVYRILEQLRITDPYWTPPGQPWKKPFVESFNDLLVDEFFKKVQLKDRKGNSVSGLPGFLGRRSYKEDERRRQIKVKDAACMHYSDFLHVLQKWLHQYHLIDKHPSLGMTPHQRWMQGNLERPILPCHYDMHLAAFHLFKQKKKHKLQSRGWLQVRGQKFSSQKAKDLYLECCIGIPFGTPIEVEAEYFDEDARYITVSVVKPGDSHTTSILVPNRNIHRMKSAVSFDEINVAPVKRRGICTIELDRLPKRKKKAPASRSEEGQSYEENLENNVTAEEVIEKSHEKFSQTKKDKKVKDKKTKQQGRKPPIPPKPSPDDEENDVLC
ncbi:hypothetical protein [Pseudoalteromonas sp. NCCP-2140]|uniref:integrase catalytic domain-containing protein n=1 Tax=Pseudoalteromonas sp. NCCP-2140 TaxID=2942288 RepID=UPI00203E08FF|nr:hypothetical protein [Pseudoalteromonas sp. NCCP-2140]